MSTCTEPAPTSNIESPQIHMPQKKDGLGVFAKILAGLLKKTAAAKESAEVPAGDEAITSQKTLLFENFVKENDENAGLIGIAAGKNTNIKELSDVKFSEEDIHILFGLEKLFINTGNINTEAETAEELPDIKSLEVFTGQEKIRDADLTDLPVLNSAFVTETGGIAETSAKAAVPAETDQKPNREESGPKAKLQTIDGLKTETAQEANNSRRNEELAALLKDRPEKEGKSRIEEFRDRDRRRDRLSFEVRDFRTETNTGTQKSTETRFLANADIRQHGDNVREITLELRLPDQGHNNAVTETLWEAKANRPGVAFEDLLARELHQNFNGDIVRHASMALRDGGAGTIRLALKPETLGNVKIRLEMAENKITGHIVVESEEALRAFRRELQSLEQAFRDSGFENASLDLSLAAGGRDADQYTREPDKNPFLTGQAAASRYDESFEQTQLSIAETAFYGRGKSSINVLA